MADTADHPPEPGAELAAPPAPRPKAPPIESRFLFVDVAAMRAKQLRRGALPRLEGADEEEAERVVHRTHPFKSERVAMEEVRRNLVLYEVPPTSKPATE
jgi:DNA-directed RNA polymerase subunit K/omega